MSSRDTNITGSCQISLVSSSWCEILKSMAWRITISDSVSTCIQSFIVDNCISRCIVSCNDNLVFEFDIRISISRNVIIGDNNGFGWEEISTWHHVGNISIDSVQCMVISCCTVINIIMIVIQVKVEWNNQRIKRIIWTYTSVLLIYC